MGDTSTIDRVTSGAVTASTSTESFLKKASSRKRDREEEKDDRLVVRIPRFASLYSDASSLETVGPSLLLPEDEHSLSTIDLVQAVDWEVMRSF